MATDHKPMSEEEINKSLKPFDAIRDKLPVEKDKISEPPEIRSSEWLNALAESWERKIITFEKHFVFPNQKIAIETLRYCLKELRAVMESVRSQNRATKNRDRSL